jgi:sialic acid synthase SpsE/quercetin dioxygenase-like cupin family protein
MSDNFDFKDLFVFDLANNHQGSVEHGLNVVRGVSAVANDHNVRGTIKFQFRQLDSFIHKDYRDATDHKHISRFLSTELKRDQFDVLLKEVQAQGLLSMCTPFDEESVAVILEMGFDILKIASCSAKDWPLLESAADSGLPIVFSTGGLSMNEIDNLISFFEHRGVDFAIMHCVSVYPSPDELLQLNQITQLRERHPGRIIGWSTHEDPNDTVPIALAVAKGAQMFERHVGVETDEIKLNAYSSTPEQLTPWLASFHKARMICGADTRPPVPAEEKESMDSLRRGVYAKSAIKEGATIERDQIYFGIPYQEGQMDSGQWQQGIVAGTPVNVDGPLFSAEIQIPEHRDVTILKQSIHETKALLNQARIALNSEFTTEYSHHYGISRFREIGAVIINCINREYCKKLVVQLPGQSHPSHFHAKKEETFQILYGTTIAEVDGHTHVLKPGETILIQPGVWHSFRSDTGAIFEEVSTTHYNDDSFYKDKAINRLERSERKTMVDHWGRFQLEPAPAVDQSKE